MSVRAAQAKAAYSGPWRGSYVSYAAAGAMSEVVCKLCGTPIRALVPAEGEPEVVRYKDRTVVKERVILACLPNYREVELLGSDGSTHTTCVCDTCAPKLADPVVAEATYCMDMEQWSKDGPVHPRYIDRAIAAIGRTDVVVQ